MIVNTRQGETENEILFLRFRPGKNLITVEALKNSATIRLVDIHLFTIRHPAEVARVKIEKLKRTPILHNSNGTDQNNFRYPHWSPRNRVHHSPIYIRISLP